MKTTDTQNTAAVKYAMFKEHKVRGCPVLE